MKNHMTTEEVNTLKYCVENLYHYKQEDYKVRISYDGSCWEVLKDQTEIFTSQDLIEVIGFMKGVLYAKLALDIHY